MSPPPPIWSISVLEYLPAVVMLLKPAGVAVIDIKDASGDVLKEDVVFSVVDGVGRDLNILYSNSILELKQSISKNFMRN